MVDTIRVSPKSYLVVWPCSATTPNKTSDYLFTSLVYHKSSLFASKILENISPKTIDFHPKEAYNNGIGSERIREKPKGKLMK
nr:MAG TPA: hypothetical protein [Bacteriophage sp.]